MREMLDTVQGWFDGGLEVALGTVVKIYGSAPRGLGAKMAVNGRGQMVGSVSGGCVEGAVVAEALEIIANGGSKLLHYGVTRDQAISVGLACGGEIEVFVQPLTRDRFEFARDNLRQDRLAAVITLLTGAQTGCQISAYPDGTVQTTLEDQALLAEVLQPLERIFSGLHSRRLSLTYQGESLEVFYDLLLPSPKLIIVGAVHIAIPLVHFANRLGFHTIVLDPRKAFASQERFSHAHELVQAWPQDYLSAYAWNRSTCLVAVSHDEKLDIPALEVACRQDPLYIGALGSPKTFEKNKAALRETGIPEEAIARIHSPIGLDIGARGPQEIALSIMAEIIAVRNSQGK